MPSVFGVTGHLGGGCRAGLCRQAWALAGSRTPVRDWNSDQECRNCSLCRAALVKVNACCHHLWGQHWAHFSSPINRCPRLTEKRIWLWWILFSIPKRGRQILFLFLFQPLTLSWSLWETLVAFAKRAATVSQMSRGVAQTIRTCFFNLQTRT